MRLTGASEQQPAVSGELCGFQWWRRCRGCFDAANDVL